MLAFISRLVILKAAAKANNGIIFTERSLFNDRNVFAQMLRDDGKINEIDFQIYNKWFHCFVDEVPLAGIVYLKTRPETCLQRVHKRGRKGESITLEYLRKCSQYHDDWLENAAHDNLLIIDGDTTTAKPGTTTLDSIIEFTQKLV